MIKTSALLLSAALLFTGCGDKDDTGTDDTDDSGTTDTTDDGITPSEGDWYADGETIVEDTCGFGDSTDTGSADDDPATLTLTSDSSFTLSDGDDLDLVCAFDSGDGTFTCDAFSEVTDYAKKGFDAVLTITQAVSGTFSSSTAGTMLASLNASCEGSDCKTLSQLGGLPLPCDVVVSYDISHGG